MMQNIVGLALIPLAPFSRCGRRRGKVAPLAHRNGRGAGVRAFPCARRRGKLLPLFRKHVTLLMQRDTARDQQDADDFDDRRYLVQDNHADDCCRRRQ